MRRGYPFALRKRIDFIDYTKNTIFTYGSSYVSYLSTILVIITMPQYSIKHYERKYLYGLFIESAINSVCIL